MSAPVSGGKDRNGRGLFAQTNEDRPLKSCHMTVPLSILCTEPDWKFHLIRLSNVFVSGSLKHLPCQIELYAALGRNSEVTSSIFIFFFLLLVP